MNARQKAAIRVLEQERIRTEGQRKRYEVDARFLASVRVLLLHRSRCFLCDKIALWRSEVKGPVPRTFLTCDKHANNFSNPIPLESTAAIRVIVETLEGAGVAP